MIDNSLLDQTPTDHKQNMYEDPAEADFMKRFYDGASCNMPGMCIEDQLDVFTVQNCRQPLSMFSFFREHEHKTMEDVPVVEVMPVVGLGAYALPTSCEYCQATSTAECPVFCSRPKLYFQKKRPPFAKRDDKKWDERTDHVLDETIEEEDEPHLVSTSSSNASKEEFASYSQDFKTNESNESYDSANRQSWLPLWSTTQ